MTKTETAYNEQYYRYQCGPIPYERSEHWIGFFSRIADEIIRSLRPCTVFDAGCAWGFLVEALCERGVEAQGVDISPYAISKVRRDMEAYCRVGSLTDTIDRQFDLVTCIEVLEHMHQDEAEAAVENFANCTDTILFSSSPNDFEEETHINVKPIISWLQLFAKYRFSPDLIYDASFVAPHAILFRRTNEPAAIDTLILLSEKIRLQIIVAKQSTGSSELTASAHQFHLLQAQLIENTSTIGKLTAKNDHLSALNEQLRAQLWIQESRKTEDTSRSGSDTLLLESARLSVTKTNDALRKATVTGKLLKSVLKAKSVNLKRLEASAANTDSLLLARRIIKAQRQQLIESENCFNDLFSAAKQASDRATALGAQIGANEWGRLSKLANRFRHLLGAPTSRSSHFLADTSGSDQILARVQAILDGWTLTATDSDDQRAIKATGLFDGEFYLKDNPDVAEGNIDPLEHYATEGWREGRRPNAVFDPKFYLTHYRDVMPTGLNPLVHYALFGIVEGKDPSDTNSAGGLSLAALTKQIESTGLFDPEYYAESNPDIAPGLDLALHYATDGWKEGRRPHPEFDPLFYVGQYPDVWSNGSNPLIHFADQGILEGLSPAAEPNEDDEYVRWVARYDTMAEYDRRAIRARISAFQFRPTVSVIMPVFNTPLELLQASVASVLAQLYTRFELCIADDASTDSSVRAYLARLADLDARIKICYREVNGNISASSNTALELATGEFVGFIDHDDILSERALFEVVAALNQNPELDLIYSDEDHIDETGMRHSPYFKSDLNYELMLGYNLINHFAVYRRSLVVRLGGLQLGYEGSQDYDLALRAIDSSNPARIFHVPKVLYHWRNLQGNASFSQSQMDRCVTSARRALADHLKRLGQHGTVSGNSLVPTWHSVKRQRPDPPPLVSIIIPTRDKPEVLGSCCNGILNGTDYPHFELIIVDHRSTEPATLAILEELKRDDRVRVLRYEAVFNYSDMNNAAVKQSNGSVLAFLNNDIEVISPQWLDELVSIACLSDVGAVGAKLLYPDRRVQHAGVVLGPGGVAGHYFHLLGAEDPGYFGRAVINCDVSAVTGACLVVKRSVFDLVSGFDAENLPVAFNDVDLCLKIRTHGFRNVFAASAVLYHHESLSRGSEDTPEKLARFQRECEFVIAKWGDLLLNDPYYNPNLDLDEGKFALAWPKRRLASDVNPMRS